MSVYLERGLQKLALDTYTDMGQQISHREVQILSSFSNGAGKALLRIVKPPDLRGVSVLLDKSDGRDPEFLVYLPLVGAARRVLGRDETESFFGTALTFFDLVPKDSAEFTASWSNELGLRGCRVMTVIPTGGDSGGYDEIRICVDTVSGVAREWKFFTGGGWSKHLVVNADSVREVDGRDKAFSFSVRSTSLGVVTRASVLEIEMDVKIPSRLFSVSNLERGSAASDRAAVLGR